MGSVYLKNRVNGQLIEAFLIDGVTLAEVQRVESSWRPIVEKSQAPVEHSHWDWRKKHEAVAGLIAYRMFGVECDDEMQGLMLVSTAGHACRIPSQQGKELRQARRYRASLTRPSASSRSCAVRGWPES